MDHDLVVIGGGTAGLGAALAAAAAGARTLLVSEGEIGGECTFTGCVPSKTLIEAAARGTPFPATMVRCAPRSRPSPPPKPPRCSRGKGSRSSAARRSSPHHGKSAWTGVL